MGPLARGGMKKVPYKEGTWFAVPLKKGGYATGCIARCKPKTALVVAYLFGPKRDHVPPLDELVSLKADDAGAVWRMGDLGLITGSWPIIGEAPHWSRAEWPMPVFIRNEEIFKKVACRVVYSEDDPDVIVSEERIPYDPSVRSTDGSCGAQYVEIALSKILDP